MSSMVHQTRVSQASLPFLRMHRRAGHFSETFSLNQEGRSYPANLNESKYFGLILKSREHPTSKAPFLQIMTHRVGDCSFPLSELALGQTKHLKNRNEANAEVDREKKIGI